MLFNSYEFVFVFLPLCVLVFLALGRASRDLALGWLIIASLVFYAWWRPINVPIIAVSLAVNYGVARWLESLAKDEARTRLRRTVLISGVIFNIAFLGYFKYTDFGLTAINDVTGTTFALRHIILPLGISFITFQKIAFLIDLNAGRIESFRLRDYLLFVLFFPQLIAGPIVHYREMMPQFHRNACRFDADAFTVGLTLFCFGLFKKAVLADGMAAYVSPVYEASAAGTPTSLFQGWFAAIGYTLQLFFDFAGYSEMAAGLARLFGVRLPMNFFSPLQAFSIIDFWSRWHMTLTRFLTGYLYNPILLGLTRRRYAAGLTGPAVRAGFGGFVSLVAVPTIVTMLVSGLWHGAGYLFLLWGLMHGIYLVVNHAWRKIVPRMWPDKQRYESAMRPIGFILTFFGVVITMVLFRSPNLHAAKDIFAGMLGLHGVRVPPALAHKASVVGQLRDFVGAANMSTYYFLTQWAWLIVLLLIALLLPNIIQMMRADEPMLESAQRPANSGLPAWRSLIWKPNLAWAVWVAVLVVAAVMRVGGPSEFLYWQF